MKEIVLSGIRPTGNLHLGNYYGAVQNFVKMQEDYNCYYFIADWHSLTTHPKPEDIQQSARTILAEYLACGIDPEKSTIYIQSDVPETIELYLYFNMNCYLGELERVTTFKEKARKQPDNVNAGLLTYPTLMAADILQHRAAKVPVGKDQEQNMEMARKCARRFNNPELLLRRPRHQDSWTRWLWQDGQIGRQLHLPLRRCEVHREESEEGCNRFWSNGT